MAHRRPGWWWTAVTAVMAAGLLGCSTTAADRSSPDPASTQSVATSISSADPGTSSGAGTAATTSGEPSVPAITGDAVGTSSSGATHDSATATGDLETTATATGDLETTGGSPVVVASYTPPADADPVDGECPYLPKDQVQSDTGQRTGPVQLRPADPQPVCEFVRSDGSFLATVRVLELGSDGAATSAVDHYVPRDTSNPESRPAGWAGGSLATDSGSTYAVSRGSTAVVAVTNQKQSVYARLLAVHAIENLGL